MGRMVCRNLVVEKERKVMNILLMAFSKLETHGAEVSIKDANHKFLRSLPPAWEIQVPQKTSLSAQNVAFVSQSKSSTNKVKSNFTSTYSTCIPSTSSTNTPEKEALAGFAD
ncbi:hypothetical protein Tco_1056801 [Tanacetum coccineum]|uniref:Uncharacterized protein n=1 Tax=Tanacetum coccineum TaxID=301880 RepID=A0ABQ5H4C1_9ASTR